MKFNTNIGGGKYDYRKAVQAFNCMMIKVVFYMKKKLNFLEVS